MIDGLKSYPAYKDSGVEWLGMVPEHWEVVPNRALFSEVNEREHPDEQMLSITISKGVIRQRSLLESSSKKDSSNQNKLAYKLVCPCDIAYNKMRAWQGAIGVSDFRGIISPAYVVMRLWKDNNPRYFHYLFRTQQFAKEVERWSYGITSDMWSLRSEHFKMIFSPIPSKDEQSAIVRFLGYTDRCVRRYIHAKQKLIKLLEEQKQAIIHHAVTRGLDPNVRLKPSDVEWLGDVPEHWEIKRAKWYFREIDERSVTGGEELLSVSHITGVTPRSEKNITMFMAESYAGHKLCREGDLVINTMWAWMAALGVARQIGIVSPAYAIYRPVGDKDYHPQFIDNLLRTRGYVAEYICRSTGIRSSRLRLYPEQFMRIPLMCPPFAEQQAILGEITATNRELDRTIQTAFREIALLREYRTRLIADVVTGKIDVREAAANLPDESDESIETEELKLLDEIESTIEVNEEYADNLDTILEEATT